MSRKKQAAPLNTTVRIDYATIIFGCFTSGMLLFSAIVTWAADCFPISLILLLFLIPSLWFTCDSIYWRVVIDTDAETMTVYRLFRKPLTIHRSEILRLTTRSEFLKGEQIIYHVLELAEGKVEIPEISRNFAAAKQFLYPSDPNA